MNKVILKTALKTLLAVIIAFILALLILCLGFPGTTADLCQSFGNYSLAETFSSLNYKYYGDIEDLYNCANYSILAKNDSKIVDNCKEFSEDERFESYCAEHDEKSDDYFAEHGGTKQRILSNLSAAQYRTGDKDGALATAKASLSNVNGFPEGNAVISLTIEIGKSKDKQTASLLKQFLDGADITPSAEEKPTFDNVIKILNTVLNQGE